MPGLEHDLLDHLLCGVESYMEKGYPFSEAYTLAVRDLNSDEDIISIQQETIRVLNEEKKIYTFPLTYVSILGILFGTFSFFSAVNNPGLILVAISLVIFFVYHIIFSYRKHKSENSNLILFVLITMLPVAGVVSFLAIEFPGFNLTGTPGWCLLVIFFGIPVYYKAVQKILSDSSTVRQLLIHTFRFLSVVSLLWILLAAILKVFKPTVPVFFLSDLLLLSATCFILQVLIKKYPDIRLGMKSII